MQVRPEIQIQTVIKAMMEDVLPALDSSNQLAMQSAQLAIGTLTLIAQHLPLQYRFDCDELKRLIELSETLRGMTRGGPQTQSALAGLQEAARAGNDVIDRARAEPGEVLDAIRGLRAAAAGTVRAVYADGPEASQQDVEQTVLAMSQEQLLRDRSWLLMQGWEPDPKAVPAIDTLLAPVGCK